jgi:Fe-S-cluster-containing dehydrogenase component
MKKWNLVIDVPKCFGCNACALACHDEYHDNDFPGVSAGMQRLGHRWIDIRQRESGRFPVVEVSYLPVTCNHCDDAPCMKAAKDGAVAKREDGIVIIDPVKAKGQKQLVAACPYGAIWWNEEKQLPQAWPFDAHLLDSGWRETRGAQVCPTRAMTVLHVDDAEMQRIVREEKLSVLHPEYKTKPRVYYRNLDRWTKVFIAGSIAGKSGGVTECIEGARVTLEQNGAKLAEALSDPYGDFRFGGLDEGSGGYSLRIEESRFAPKTVAVTLGKSAVLDNIMLDNRAGA